MWDAWRSAETWLGILAVLVGAVIVRALIIFGISRWTKHVVARAKKRRETPSGTLGALRKIADPTLSERHATRTRALAALLNSIVTLVIVTVAIATCIAMLGVPVAPLIAATGVGGVALGIGAQGLVKDFLAGISIIIEDQYGLGDIVTIDDLTGTVEDIGLRVTRLRDSTGQIWYIRNGEIVKLGNISQGWSTAMVEVPMSPHADTDRATKVLEKVAHEFDCDPEYERILVQPTTVAGVNQVTGDQKTIMMIAKTEPNQHYGVQRELLARAVAALAAAGIHGPLPSRVGEAGV
ncbi:MAG: mechanosensitive ion channel family protein [Propionibacteriaceae bacterium]|jgi:small conductance mechanosensitive channel|nr:mechanosensitive ion channel family protein [Propionibacteriaceae bacterium]